MAIAPVALCPVLDRHGSSERIVRSGHGLAGDAQGFAAPVPPCSNGQSPACVVARTAASGACWRHESRRITRNVSTPWWSSLGTLGRVRWIGFDRDRCCKACPNLRGRSNASTKFENWPKVLAMNAAEAQLEVASCSHILLIVARCGLAK